MGNNSSHAIPITGDENCVICQENINNSISRPDCCPNHFFHHDCLMEWAKHKNTCPLDNREFSAIIDKKGNEYRVKKPKEDNVELLSTLFERMLLLTQLMRNRFRCDICSEEHSDLERAKTDVCDHRFHRKCLANLARISQVCPVADCNSEFSEIRCEFGEVMAVVELKEAYECLICNGRVNDEETATPNECKHRFHRRCLHPAAKRTKKCPISSCNSDIHFIKCEKGERIVIQNSITAFECTFCDQTDPEKESARISPCGHQFHRECFLSRYRDLNNCPLEDCHGAIDLVHCQFGDTFERQANPINNLIATVTCGDDFKCSVCDSRNPEWERAKLDCGCEFHRRCIVQVARRQTQLLCLRCKQPYTTINCLHGDSLTVERRSLVSNAESSSESTSSVNTENDKATETNTNNATASDEMIYSEGAVGGSDAELHTCNLCESPIPQGDATRPRNCSHWYHKVCMMNLSSEIGCCISCQGDLSNNVEESGAVNNSHNTSNEEGGSRCYTCGDVINRGEIVRPDGCLCLFHRSCLNSIKLIMSFCPICEVKFTSTVDVA